MWNLNNLFSSIYKDAPILPQFGIAVALTKAATKSHTMAGVQ